MCWSTSFYLPFHIVPSTRACELDIICSRLTMALVLAFANAIHAPHYSNTILIYCSCRVTIYCFVMALYWLNVISRVLNYYYTFERWARRIRTRQTTMTGPLRPGINYLNTIIININNIAWFYSITYLILHLQLLILDAISATMPINVTIFNGK